MRGPKPTPIELEKPAQETLEKLVKQHTVGQQIALRGRIILAAGAGQNNSQIARELGVSVDMVRLWRKRWLTLQAIPLPDLSVAERLEDLPRAGAPARITADQRCRIERLACEQPEISGRPITHWTHQEIADELVKQGIVEKISARHAGRLLKRRGYQAPSHSLLADPGGRCASGYQDRRHQ